MFLQFDDSLKTMQNRIFYLWVALCLLANTVGTAFNYITKGWASITMLCTVIGLVMLGVVAFAVIFDKKSLASAIIFLLLTWIEFPAIYMEYGSIAIAYFALSIFAGTIVFPLKGYFAFATSSVLWYGLIVAYEAMDGPIVTLVYNEMTYFILVIAIIAIQGALLFYYEKQKKELNEAKASIEYIASHDSLTGLFNRGYLMNDLEKRMADTGRFIVALIDIDNFKKFNDNYGHQVGDAVLKKFGQEIIENLGDLGYAARYGGEEIMLVYDDTDEDAFRRMLLHIRNVVNRHFEKENSFGVTFSGGISRSIEHKTVAELIRTADERLYEAKNSGKDKVY